MNHQLPDENTDPNDLEAWLVKELHGIAKRVTKLEAGQYRAVIIAVVAAILHALPDIIKALHSP